MARPIWKGSISFGLVNIPVTLFSGETRSDIHFRLLDSRNNARVRYERVNEITGHEVPWDKIVKAFDYDDGNYVLLTEKDFEAVAIQNSQSVEINDFVPVEEINFAFFDKPYVLVPGKKGEKGYVLLRETLRRTKKAGIAKVIIRTRQSLAAVMVQGDALMLNILRFNQEIRPLKEFDLPDADYSKYKISDKEIAMAEQLVDAMTAEWKPSQYHDEYRDALMKWIEKKAESEGEVEPPEPLEEKKPAGEIIDIMDLLKKSMKHTSEREKKPEPGATEDTVPARDKPKAKSKAKAKPAAKSKPKAPAKKRKAS